MIKYSIVAESRTQSCDITVDEFCNGWTVINKGGLTIAVNGVPLLPGATADLSGESFGPSGNIGEIYGGRIQILFNVNDPRPLAVVIQKIYLPNQQM